MPSNPPPGSRCAIALCTVSDAAVPSFVGTLDGAVISDDELRRHSPALGRTLVMLRRLDHIMSRTRDARSRRGALLGELAEWYWNESMSESLRCDRSPSLRTFGPSLTQPEPVIDASAIWSSPE